MKRAIGIDINKKYISLVQLCYKRDKFYLEKTYIKDISQSISATETSPDDVRAAIKEIIHKEDFDTKAPAIISMPFGRVFFHNYRTELSTDRDIERLIKFELEDDFPVPFDDLITEICGSSDVNEQEREFLVAAVSRSELQNWTKAMSESGIDCSIVTSDVCALSSLILQNQKANYDGSSIIIYIDDCRLITAVSQNNSLKIARHTENLATRNMITILKREITLTLKAISDFAKPLPSKILLCGSQESLQSLFEELSKDTDYKIEIVDPFERKDDSIQQKADNRLIIASGLALISMDNKNQILNFLAADKVKTEEKTKTRRNAIVFVSLLLAIAIMFLVNLFIHLRSLENENQSLEEEIRQIFVQTFPDEKRIVNELAQTNEKYKALEQEYNAIASEISDKVPILKIFEEITGKITNDQNVRISRVSISPDLTQLSATAADFESVDNLVEKLKQISLFDSIDIKNLDLDPMNNRVRFNLSIKNNVNYSN